MLKDRLTLLIHSCDKFSDLWPAHTTLLNKNWPDRDIATYILSDSVSDFKCSGVEVLSAGDGKEITERIRYALPILKTEYVLVTLDDYFLIDPISSDKISRLLDIMDKEGYDYLRLFKRPKSPLNETPYKDVYTYDLNGGYRVNLYAGIWRRSFIEKTLGNEVLNAWNFEVHLTDNARKVNGKCAVSYGEEFPILDVVRKGKILNKAYRYLKKNDLYHGERPVMPLRSEFFLWIRTNVDRLLRKTSMPLYRFVRNICVKMGMNSFSARNNK